MKTPKEIMEGLGRCGLDALCDQCPYITYDDCQDALHKDVAAFIRQLQDVNRALQTEVYVNRKPDTKADDQEAKADAEKPRLTLVPPRIIWEIAKVREFGTAKYHDPENWRTVEPDRLWAACTRHIVAAWNDYRATDADSGLLHLAHAATNLAFLLQMIGEEDQTDG